ncbi:hypothetical protein [Actinophytocola sp.]|uniref:hypothetical protein n=1 Tax=Actinophytocola sp. TaxID=1872138 RepID=UPI003D6A913B
MAISQGGLDPWAVQLRIGERDARYALGALLGPVPGRMMAWADGVLPSRTENGVVVDLKAALGANDGLGVAFYPGQCVINRPGQGPYVCTLDRTGRVQLDDADPSNPRVDLIVARVYDERQGDPRTEFVIEPVTGLAGPEPVEPPLPPVSFPIARVALPAGTTQLAGSMFTDLRRAASVRTGVGVVLPGDDPTLPGAYAGHTRYRAGTLEAFDGETRRGTPATWSEESVELVARTGITGIAALTSIGVPDPGWPYRLMISGCAELTGTNCRADLTIRLDAADGAVLARGVGPTNGWSWVTTPARNTRVLNGAHTLYLSGERVGAAGTWANFTYNGALSLLRLPA